MTKTKLENLEKAISVKEDELTLYELKETQSQREEINRKIKGLPFFGRCDGILHAKGFEEEYFLNLFADYTTLPSNGRLKDGNPKEVLTKDGTYVKVLSKNEEEFVKKMDNNPLVKHIRSGSYPLVYTHKHSKHTYYPDFFIYLTNHRILVVEVKPTYFMEEASVKRKYEFLRHHCLQNYLMCVMCDSELKVSNDIFNLPIPSDFEAYVLDKIISNGKFSHNDLAEYKRNKHQSDFFYENALAHIVKRFKLKLYKVGGKDYNYYVKGTPHDMDPVTEDDDYIFTENKDGLRTKFGLKDLLRNLDVYQSKNRYKLKK